MRFTAYSPIVLLLLLPSTFQDDSCFALTGTTTCPAFQDYYISLSGLSTRYPFLQNVTDIKTFDAGMQSFVTSPQLYLAPLGCTNKASVASTIPYARYSKTYVCATLIQDSISSLPCNYNHSVNPPSLCQQTCFDYLASVDSLTDTTDTCPNLVQQQNNLANLNSSCEFWSGLNGTDDCILGIANEPSDCGFLSISEACDYCKTNGTDTCCKTIHCQNLFVGGIIGIVIGCVVFLGLLGGLGFFYYKKKQRKMRMKQQFNDSSSVFGYESLAASQRVLLPSQPQMNKPPPLTIQPQPVEEFFEVKHPYPPQMGDELGLHVGDIVCVAMNFDDGWALGFNVTTGLKGVFPLVCVAPVPEELLEQLLMNESTTKILVEDNLRRSLSLASHGTLPTTESTQHGNIPRRTASIMRSYDYRESDSPTSPTLSTPFFDPHHSVTQPTVQNQEAFEMHGKNNRISKLEE